jgi:AcrR family transcriptional regulator
MFDEAKPGVRRRRYRKRRRAELEERTRRRITEAAMHLHGSVGPARTTVSAVAREASVQRSTVYRHFPTDVELFAACSAHWISLNPPPDPATWKEIGDPAERLRAALAELYGWYAWGERMLVNITRDASLVPAMKEPMQAFGAYLDGVQATLMGGRHERGRRRRRVAAAIALSLAFTTWRSLAREAGLDDDEAAELMASAVETVDGSASKLRGRGGSDRG